MNHILESEYETEGSRYYLINMPIILRSPPKSPYLRSKYIFSFCIQVEKSKLHHNQDSYYEIVKKFAYLLTQMQLSKNTIYSHQIVELQSMIDQLYIDLNEKKQSFIQYDDSQYMYLHFNESKKQEQYQELRYYMVPFPIVDLRNGMQTDFNPILSKLLPEVNGINCIGVICEQLKPFSAQQVKAALQEMIEFKLIVILDMIHQTNVYSINENIFKIFNKESEILNKALPHLVDLNKINEYQAIQILQTLYFEFKRGVILKDYIKKNEQLLKFTNLYRLIRFGQLNMFLVRLHEYPIEKLEQNQHYFHIANSKQYLSKYVRCSDRFNEEQKQIQKSQLQLDNQVHSSQHTLEHSRKFEQGYEINQYNLNKVNESDKIKDANETINRLIHSGVPFDEIRLIFTMDLDTFQQLILEQETIIIHK